MKKILFLLISTISILLPVKVFATSSSSNLDAYFEELNIKSFEFMYQNNDYLMNKLSNYDYKLITSYWSTYQMPTGKYWFIVNLTGFENEVFLQNYYRSGYQNYLNIIGNPTRYNVTYYYYYDLATDKFYSDNTFTTEITSITDSLIQIENTNTDKVRISDNFSSASTNYNYRLYFNNIELDNSGSYHRPITLYDINNELIGTYNTGDILPSYVSLYHDRPSYLNGYKKVTLTTQDKYLMISDISSGSIYIPYQAFNDYGGRLSYYDNDLQSQSYLSYIQDYTKMSDELYIRQDFDISSYYGADWVMFSKYIYLEGEDNITYDIWVPDTSYDSNVTITPNNQGGNDFDFTYKDENGDIQNGQVSSEDLQQQSPLLGNIFEDFSSNTFGLTSIITAPLSLINSLTSSTCNDLSIPLPYVNSNLTLPCMTTIYQSTFGNFFTLYQTITFGIVSYWVIVKIWNLVKDFKNPDHDEIEVLDL